MLRLYLVVPVVRDAEWVEVLLSGERAVPTPGYKGSWLGAKMIGDLGVNHKNHRTTHHIDHQIHATGVKRIGQIQKVLARPKTVVQLCMSVN